VAGCEQVGERLWSVTVVFLETPEEMAKIRNSKVEFRGDFRGSLLA
jgi:hypothetical protein